MPAWFYDWETAPKFDPARDGPLQDKLSEYLKKKGLDRS